MPMLLKIKKNRKKDTVEHTAAISPKITIYVDLLFCLVILPLIIMLVPIDKWFVTQPVFVVTLIVYIYLLYFVYRNINLPSLFIRKKYGYIILVLALLMLITELVTHFPPAGKRQLQTPAGISPPSPFPNCVVFLSNHFRIRAGHRSHF